MNYTLHQLRLFYKVYQNQSITKTAEEMLLSQPAVSIQLKKFQDQFPMPLTEIVGRRLYLTDFGKKIADMARVIIEEVELLDQHTQALDDKLVGTLKLTVVSTAKYVIPYYLSGFYKANPGVDIQMDVTNKSTVLSNMEVNAADLALVSLLPGGYKVHNLELLPNVLCLIGKKGLYEPDHFIREGTLEQSPLIFREQGSATRLAMETFLSERQIRLRKKMELTSNEAVKQSVLAGLGLSVMPLIGLRNELQNGELQVYPTPGLPITTHWNLIWMSGKKFSPVLRAFIDYVRSNTDDIVREHFSWSEEYISHSSIESITFGK